MRSFEESLDAVLRSRIGGCRGLVSAERLSGGASQETYRLVIRTDAGERKLAMRRAPGAVSPSAGQVGLVAVDAKVLGLPLITISTAHHGPELEYLEPGVDLFSCLPTVAALADTMTRVTRLRAHGQLMPTFDDDLTVEAMAKRFAEGLVAMAASSSST